MALGVLTGERREDVTGREPKGRAGVASLIAPPDRWLKANPARLLTGRRPVGAGHPRRTVRPTRSLRCILPAGPIWGDRMSRGKSPDGRRRSRIWLGPPGRGGERLSHLFEIEPARGRDFESRLDELRADVHRLERQVEELGHATLSADTAFEQSAPSGRDAGRPLRRTVDLRSGPPPKSTATTGWVIAKVSPSSSAAVVSAQSSAFDSRLGSIGQIFWRCGVVDLGDRFC
jgi:hypothetical protein